LVDDYSIETKVKGGGPYIGGFYLRVTERHSGAAWDIRPGLKAGYSWNWGSVGADLSYMSAWGDFGNLGSHAGEFRAGLFLWLRF
jgi:hypothetical protein